MSKLQEKINEDLKQAMRDKNELALSVLRMLNSAIKNKMIALRSGEEVVLSDEQVMEVISSEVKKRIDSIEVYLQGGRIDLADKEKSEIEILKKYLPEELSDEEIEKVIREIFAQNQDQDFGKIMGLSMSQLKGRADGRKVGEIVKKILNQ